MRLISELMVLLKSSKIKRMVYTYYLTFRKCLFLRLRKYFQGLPGPASAQHTFLKRSIKCLARLSTERNKDEGGMLGPPGIRSTILA